jgi:hypothetical protein
MARARTIKPNFLRSRSMRAVSAMARLTFIQLWLLADDAGRLMAHPRQLAHWLYPGDDGHSIFCRVVWTSSNASIASSATPSTGSTTCAS